MIQPYCYYVIVLNTFMLYLLRASDFIYNIRILLSFATLNHTLSLHVTAMCHIVIGSV